MLDEDKVRERISLFYAGDDTSWNRGVVSLSALGAEVAPHILPLLDDENPFARAGAAEVFGRMRHAEAIPLLLKKLGDGDWFVRAKAAAALGKIGNACAAGPLKALFMREPHPWARESIAWALGQICEPGTIPTLCYALGDHYSGVVRTASRGLERMVPRNENDLRLLQNGISRLSLQKDVGTSRVDLEKCAGELRRTSRAWAEMLQDAMGESQEKKGQKRFRGRRGARERSKGRNEILGEIGNARPLRIRL